MQQQLKVEKIKLVQEAEIYLGLLSKSKPLFPQYLSRKISQQVGLQCSEENMFKLMSTFVDYSLKDLMSSISQSKSKARKKKEEEQSILKTSDVEKQLESRNLKISKGHFIPELGINNTKDL